MKASTVKLKRPTMNIIAGVRWNEFRVSCLFHNGSGCTFSPSLTGSQSRKATQYERIEKIINTSFGVGPMLHHSVTLPVALSVSLGKCALDSKPLLLHPSVVFSSCYAVQLGGFTGTCDVLSRSPNTEIVLFLYYFDLSFFDSPNHRLS